MQIDLGAEGKLLAEVSWQPAGKQDHPALILFHGLEGSARSHYLIGISKKAFARGFHTVRVNMRNCGGTEHLSPTLYCAALSQDVLSVVRHLRDHHGIRDIYGMGVSLGANILLKFLGEQQNDGDRYLKAAAVISPPLDLALGARLLMEPSNWMYQRHFVKSLIQRLRRKSSFFPGIADIKRVEKIRTIWEFDDVVTAPHFGFASAEDYYRKASCGPLLREIRVPTLLIHSEDDPLIPLDPFLTSGIEKNPHLLPLLTRHGGHAGFMGSKPATDSDLDEYWAECRAVDFFVAHRRSAAAKVL